MRILILFIATAALMTACNSDLSEEIAKVELMEQKVDEAEMIFLSWNLDSLKTAGKAINAKVNMIKELLETGNIDISDEEAITVADFKAAAKAFKKMDLKVPQIIEEIGYSREQLRALKNDLSNASHSKDEFSSYLKNENQACVTLLDSVKKLDEGFQKSNSRVYRLGPGIDKFIDRLSSN